MSDHRHRCGRLVTAVTAVCAFLTLGITPLATAPAANADIDDLFQPIAEAVALLDPSLAGDAVNPLAALDTMFADLEQSWLANPLGQSLDSLIDGSNGLGWLFGTDPGAAAFLPGAAADPGTALTTASVPLQINATTEPVVDVSVGGGASAPVLVDTGSAGLVLPIWNMGLENIGFPTGIGFGAYSGGLEYVYLKIPTTVSFGDDLNTGQEVVTGPTSVDAVIFSFPTNLFGPWTIADFLGPANAVGILGIGPNAIGPTPGDIPTADLPGALGHGVLIDQANKELVFGDNPLIGGTTVPGAPNATLYVSIDGGTTQAVQAIIDSGGVYGTMPSSVLGGASTMPDGTTIAVYADQAGHNLLYSYEVNAVNAPTVTSGTTMNTGNIPFAQQPIYTSYSPAGSGTTIFGGPANAIER